MKIGISRTAGVYLFAGVYISTYVRTFEGMYVRYVRTVSMYLRDRFFFDFSVCVAVFFFAPPGSGELSRGVAFFFLGVARFRMCIGSGRRAASRLFKL